MNLLKTLLFVLIFSSVTSGYSQFCTPDTNFQSQGIYPDRETGLGGLCIGDYYFQVINLVVEADTTAMVPGFGMVDLTINYITLDSVFNIPDGFSFTVTPADCTFFPGNSCIQLEGPATVQNEGLYYFQVYVTANVSAKPGQGVVSTLVQNVNQPFLIDYYAVVISGGPEFDPILTPELCQQENGILDLNLTGYPPYTYTWSANLSGTDTTWINSLDEGIYSVTMSDSFGCVDSVTMNLVNENTVISVSPSLQPAYCGANDGNIDLNVTGIAPFQYAWSNPTWPDTPFVSGIAPGTYNVTVTDSAECSLVTTFQIGDEKNPEGYYIFNAATCNQSNGNLSILVNGSAPYSFHWEFDSLLTDSILIGQPSGLYTCIVSDVHGCQDTVEAYLPNENMPRFDSIVVSHPNCSGQTTGEVSVFVEQGIPPLSYLWSNQHTTAAQDNLSSGNYSLTVTDQNGCAVEANITLHDPPSIEGAAWVNDASCSGCQDGSIELAVLGGTPPFQYLWSNGATSPSPQNLEAGTYSVTLSDANNCQWIETYQVESLVAMDPSASSNSQILIQYAPNSGLVTIVLENKSASHSFEHIKLFDLQGRLIVQDSFSSKDKVQMCSFSELDKGIYVVSIYLTGGQKVNKKVILY